MNIQNWCAVVGISKRIYVKQLHGICTILSITSLFSFLVFSSPFTYLYRLPSLFHRTFHFKFYRHPSFSPPPL
jgi:hypothetical protein